MTTDKEVIHYLDNRISELDNDIAKHKQHIETNMQSNVILDKELTLLRIHWTSLMNTRLAYKSDEE